MDIKKYGKRKPKIIDAVSYNGRYVDPAIIKSKVIAATAILCSVAGFGILMIL